MFFARNYLMFESEDFCLGHYLTIVKTPTVLDHFLLEIFFYICIRTGIQTVYQAGRHLIIIFLTWPPKRPRSGIN